MRPVEVTDFQGRQFLNYSIDVDVPKYLESSCSVCIKSVEALLDLEI